MVIADDVSDRFRRFMIRMVKCIFCFIHRVQDAPLHRFETVPRIRKRTFLNDIFGVASEPVGHDVFKSELLHRFLPDRRFFFFLSRHYTSTSFA